MKSIEHGPPEELVFVRFNWAFLNIQRGELREVAELRWNGASELI